METAFGLLVAAVFVGFLVHRAVATKRKKKEKAPSVEGGTDSRPGQPGNIQEN